MASYVFSFSAMQERIKERINKELKKKQPNSILIKQLLTEEFHQRRQYIADLSANDRHLAVLENYPCFKDHEYVSAH